LPFDLARAHTLYADLLAPFEADIRDKQLLVVPSGPLTTLPLHVLVTGRDPKTVRKYIERGIEAPPYGPRSVGRPSKLAPYMTFLRERVTTFPELTAARLTREDP
jgi:hypothetical protein